MLTNERQAGTKFNEDGFPIPAIFPVAEPEMGLWETYNDVASSYLLAMQAAGIDSETIEEIVNTVADYMSNRYGDD